MQSTRREASRSQNRAGKTSCLNPYIIIITVQTNLSISKIMVLWKSPHPNVESQSTPIKQRIQQIQHSVLSPKARLITSLNSPHQPNDVAMGLRTPHSLPHLITISRSLHRRPQPKLPLVFPSSQNPRHKPQQHPRQNLWPPTRRHGLTLRLK